jgi:hypothetical protein
MYEINIVSSKVNGHGEIGSFRAFDAVPMLRIPRRDKDEGDDYDYYGVIQSGNERSFLKTLFGRRGGKRRATRRRKRTF